VQKKSAAPVLAGAAPFQSSGGYLLQFAHSEHLPLQQAAQSLSLQHSGQLVPLACRPESETTAMATAARIVFIIFLSFEFKKSSARRKSRALKRNQTAARGGGCGGRSARKARASSKTSQENLPAKATRADSRSKMALTVLPH